jgi:esterase/lipase
MHHEFRELRTATSNNRAVIFVHGFQGHYRTLGSPTTCSSWSRGLRGWGYAGRIFAFRWFAELSDGLHRGWRDWRAEEAAGKLWEFIDESELPIRSISLLGFSMGGDIIYHVLRHAACNDLRFRRVYFVGAAASRAVRWRRLLASSTRSVWNFHSHNDRLLRRFYPDAIGLSGFHDTYNSFYPNTRDIDCTSFIDSHDEWAPNLSLCLWHARLSGAHL